VVVGVAGVGGQEGEVQRGPSDRYGLVDVG
jgi:hypothetical protein